MRPPNAGSLPERCLPPAGLVFALVKTAVFLLELDATSGSRAKYRYLAMEMMMMTVPKLGEPLGSCSLAPWGVGACPITKIDEEKLELLFSDMKDSCAEQLRSKFRQKQIAELKALA